MRQMRTRFLGLPRSFGALWVVASRGPAALRQNVGIGYDLVPRIGAQT